MRKIAIFLMIFSLSLANFIDDVKIYKDKVEFYSKNVDKFKIGQVFRDDFIKCNPKIEGIFYKNNNNLITFYANEQIPTSSTFECEYKGEKIRFKSDDFKVENFKNIAKNRFFISFNDDVSSQILKENVKVINLDNEIVDFRIYNLNKTEFIIEVFSDKNYTLKISKNIKNRKNYSLKDDIFIKSLEKSGKDLKKYKTLQINTNLIQPISYPNKMLGFRLFVDDYLWIDNVLVSAKNSQNFKVIKSGYEIVNSLEKRYFDIVSRDLKDNTEYKITLKKGFGEENYQVLKENLTFKLKTGDFYPDIKFLDDKPYISSKGGIAIESINLKEIKTVLSKVEDENLRYFLNFNERKNIFSDEKSRNFSIDFEPNKEIKSVLKFDFKQDGIYKLEIFYKDKQGDLKNINKFVYYSDLALHAKIFQDEIFVFANRLSNNEVVKNAKITIFSDKNKILATGYTNKNGVFKFAQKNIILSNPKSILINLNNERNFLILKNANIFKNTAQKPKAFVYFASKIVRPNSPMDGVIVLKKNFKSIKNLPIKVKIYNPQNSKIYENSFMLDEFGTAEIKFEDGFEMSGKYSLEVIFEDKILAKKEFFVESFVPQNLKVNAKFSKDAYFKGEKPLVNLSANYLFGQNASNLNGNLSISFINSAFKNEKFGDFIFDGENLDQNLYFDEKSIFLDKNATSKMLINPSFNTNLNSVLNINASFLINDNGKNAAGYANSKFYPFESIVGVKLDKYIINENETIKANFINISPKTLNKIKGNLKATLYKTKWMYNYDEKGFISWFKKDERLKEFDIKNDFLEISNLNFGHYKLEVMDLHSSHKSIVKFEVNGNDSDELTPTNQLSKAVIKADKTAYNDNEMINLSISSVLKNPLMLVTFESGKLMDFRVVKLKGNTANISFKTPKNFKGGYVKAKILRLSDISSIFLPFKAQNSIYLEKNSSKHNLTPKINALNIVNSGKNLEILVHSKPHTKIVLFGVEEGILNLLDQKSPQVFEFFKTKINDLKADFDIYDELTNFKNDGKILQFGSGEMLMKSAMKKYIDPLENKKVNTFMFMQTAIANENGTAKFSKFIPQNLNTKIRLDAIAISDDKIGENTSFVTIKDDIFIKAPLISYLLKGDEISLIFKIFNNTTDTLRPNINISKSNNLEIFYDKNLSIEKNSFKDLIIKTKALNTGNADINISLNNKTTNLNFEILEANSLSTNVKSGIINNKKDFIFNNFGAIKINISPNLQSLFINDANKLINYPYGCAEQKSSQLLALLFSRHLNKTDKVDRENFINLGIKDLLNLQNKNGDFAYWKADSNINEFASIYAIHTLFLLKENGFNVPQNALNKAVNALNLKNINYNLENIYALYVLSQNSKLDLSQKINLLYDNKFYEDDLIRLYLTATILKKAGLKDELNAIKEKIKSFDISKIYAKNENFSSKIRDLSFALYLNSKHFNDKNMNEKLINEIILLKDEIKSTQDRAFVLLAINEFENLQNENEKLKIIVKNGDITHKFSQNADFEMALKDKNLSIQTDKKAYYSLINYEYKQNKIKNELENKILNIKREFVNANGDKIDLNNIKLNDLIFAKITLKFNKNFNDIYVYQKSPSCFEIVNENIIQNIRNDKVKDEIRFMHQEIKDNSITNFLPPVFEGESATFYTPFKAVLSGVCKLPQANTESMYNEKINNYSLEAYEIKVK